MMIAALTSSVVMIFFTAEFCAISPADATQHFGGKKFPGLSCAFSFLWISSLSCRNSAKFQFISSFEWEGRRLWVFYCFVTTGHSVLLGFGGCSQQSGGRSWQSVMKRSGSLEAKLSGRTVAK